MNILKQGKLEDNIYYLPEIQLDRKEYLELAKHLKFLGGKWNKGKGGFIFDREIESIDELLGDNTNRKKQIQLFETPEIIADKLVELAELKKQDVILEPSAGRGRIIKAIRKVLPNREIAFCEIDEINRKYLDKIDNLKNIINTGNFLDVDYAMYDKIIANPPFSKNQDIDHIMKMYELLNNKGIIVSIASKHWELSNNKKETNFRKFLKDVNAEIIELDGEVFKESGTIIKTVIIKILKPTQDKE